MHFIFFYEHQPAVGGVRRYEGRALHAETANRVREDRVREDRALRLRVCACARTSVATVTLKK